MDGQRGVLEWNIRQAELQKVMRDPALVGSVEDFCAPPSGPLSEQGAYETLPCSAGHTACYVSTYGDVYPCVQFTLPTGNVRKQKFIDIWPTPRSSRKCAPSVWPIWKDARSASTPAHARVVRGWRT